MPSARSSNRWDRAEGEINENMADVAKQGAKVVLYAFPGKAMLWHHRPFCVGGGNKARECRLLFFHLHLFAESKVCGYPTHTLGVIEQGLRPGIVDGKILFGSLL